VRQEIKALARREDASLFMTLLAAFYVLLGRASGQDDLVVGTSVATRDRAELQGLIGFFVNNVALRTSIAGDPTFRELLARVRQTSLDAFAHQDLPFDRLVEALRLPRGASHTPVYQVQFLFRSSPVRRDRFGGLGLSRLGVGTPVAKFDLTLEMAEEGDELSGVLNYDTALFHAATIRRLAGQFQALLETIAADPDRRLSELGAAQTTPEEESLLGFNADLWEQYEAFEAS
jgi:fengycin family lipopeptide synthetase B